MKETYFYKSLNLKTKRFLSARNYFVIAIIFSLFVPAISSCSSGPSESYAKQLYQKYLDESWPSSCKVLEFNILKRFSENESHIVETKYYAKVEIINDLADNGFGTGGTHLCGLIGIRFLNPPTMKCPDFEKNPFQQWKPKDYTIKKGYVFEVEGTRSWNETVNGWE